MFCRSGAFMPCALPRTAIRSIPTTFSRFAKATSFFLCAKAECGTVVWSDEIDIVPEHLYESSWLCHRTRSESVKMKSAAQMQAQAESCAMPNGSWKKNMPRSSAIVGLRYWKKPRTFSGKRFAP